MKRIVIGILVLLVGIPFLFYLNFGAVGPIGFGLTLTLVSLLALYGLGQYSNEANWKHAPSSALIIRGDWLDKVTFSGLVFFILGPFIGFIITSSTAILPTESSWRWQYKVRVVLAIAIPVMTALLVLIFHVERRSRLIYFPIVLVVTAMPVWSAVRPLLDLAQGPQIEKISHGCYFNRKTLTCYCNGREVFCPNMVKDEEIVVLPWTHAVLAQRTLAD